MSETQTGRYGVAHSGLVAQLLMRTDLTSIERFDRVMAHARELERERDEALARAAALDAQLTYIIEG
ncbi:MAG: hypothetical protein ACYCZR_03945 [Burkholderiales bacterium]